MFLPYSIVKYRIRTWLGLYPSLFFPLMQMFGSKHNELLTSETELVIEGFPRSANSFAVRAFLNCQKRPVKVAHHLHVPAQVLRAAQNNIPVLVLVRNPTDAILALKVIYPWLPIKDVLKAYYLFHKKIMPCIDKVFVATFEEATTDYGTVIRRVNKKFGTRFEVFEHTKENVDRVFEIMEGRTKSQTELGNIAGLAPFPTSEKEATKKQLMGLFDDRETRVLLDACANLYEAICSAAKNS